MTQEVPLAARIRDLKKYYELKGETVRALRGVSFDIPEGDYIAIMGRVRFWQKYAAESARLPGSPDPRFVCVGWR